MNTLSLEKKPPKLIIVLADEVVSSSILIEYNNTKPKTETLQMYLVFQPVEQVPRTIEFFQTHPIYHRLDNLILIKNHGTRSLVGLLYVKGSQHIEMKDYYPRTKGLVEAIAACAKLCTRNGEGIRIVGDISAKLSGDDKHSVRAELKNTLARMRRVIV